LYLFLLFLENKPKKMKVNQITKCAINYRGIILNEMAKLEKMIDIYLSGYFFTHDIEKMNELFALVFAGLRITFENKRGILDYLCKTKQIEFEKEYPELLKDMQDLFSDRKIMAHYMVDTSKEAELLPKKTVRFISLNNKLEFKIFNEADILDNEKKMDKMMDIFLKRNLERYPPLI
jgi:hypothetical protein